MGIDQSNNTNHDLLVCFGLGFRSNRIIEGTPFIYWLIVGICMWFY